MLLRTRIATVAVAALAAVVGLVAGCDGPRRSTPPQPVGLAWQELTLPVPPGDPGRIAVRDVVACGGKWFVVGGVIGAEDATRPAAWTSADGQTWRLLSPEPTSLYGKLNILYSAGCRDGVLAAIGAKRGGAHGNPRTSTWYLHGDTLSEVTAAFTLYGGTDAVNVGRIVGGPKGWLIAGNRVTGAAAWLSADATDFRLIENSPGLASDPTVVTQADDGAAARDGWVVIGGGRIAGHIDSDPLAWTSNDGERWHRVTIASDAQYEELQRVVRVGDDLLAAGLHGSTFGVWRGTGDNWQPVGRFGASAETGLAGVRSMTVIGSTVLVSAQDGAEYGLWLSADRGRSWRTATMPPGAHPSGAENDVAISANGDAIVLVGDDAQQGRAWFAHYSG
jgi:hypothetical protein